MVVEYVHGQLVSWEFADAAAKLEGVDPTFGTAAVSVIMNEFLEVVRLPFILASTPALVKMIRRE